MNLDQALDKIEAAIVAEWVSGEDPRTTIAWPNVSFTPPDDAAWLKVDILWGDGFVETKDGLNLVVGVLNLGIFTPVGAGDGPLMDLIVHARAMFNRADKSGVRFGVPSGPTFATEPKWRQGTISVDFVVEETIT